MLGVDVYALRKTHRTWAEASGVPPLLIDMQLGHAAPDDATALMKLLIGSVTGRTHYLDKDAALFDPARSAVAVRERLDQAMEKVMQEKTVLVADKLADIRKSASA